MLVNERCIANGTAGVIRYIGSTDFSQGIWVGVELDLPLGKNDGSIQGLRYFQCNPDHGVFVRASKILPLHEQVNSTEAKELVTEASRSKLHNNPEDAATKNPARSSLANRIVPETAATTTSKVQSKLSTSSIIPPSPSTSRRSTNLLTKPKAVSRTPTTSSQTGPPIRIPSNLSISSSFAASSDELTQQQEGSQSKYNAGTVPSIKAAAPEFESSSELDALKMRLVRLEAQRAEDLRRLSRLGALEAEKQVWVTIKSKLRDKLQTQQVEIAELKEKARILEEAMERSQQARAVEISSNHVDAIDLLEMATLDREMAEEERDQIRKEVDQLKSRNEELSLELEILREENDMSATAGSINHTTDLKAATVQNERLKEALIRLKEISSEQEKVLRNTTRESESRLSTVKELNLQLQTTRSQLKDMEITILDLRTQVDLSIGAEEMLESLSERNLVLGEQLETCRAEITDLQALQSVHDEIEEAYLLTRGEYDAELQLRDAIMASQTTRLAEQEQNVLAYEETIAKFRTLVKSLQEERDRLKNDESHAQDSTAKATQKVYVVETENKGLKDTQIRVALSWYESEMRKLDLAAAMEHLQVMRNYLPISYENDKSAVEAYLKVYRISGLASIMYELFRDKVKQSQLIEATRYLPCLHESRELMTLGHMACLATQLGSTETFQKLGELESLSDHPLYTIESSLQAILCAASIDELDTQNLGELVGKLRDLKDKIVIREGSYQTLMPSWRHVLQSLLDAIVVVSKENDASLDRDTALEARQTQHLPSAIKLSTNLTRQIIEQISSAKYKTQIVSSILKAQTRDIELKASQLFSSIATMSRSIDGTESGKDYDAHRDAVVVLLKLVETLHNLQESFLAEVSLVEMPHEGVESLTPWTIRGRMLQQANNNEEKMHGRMIVLQREIEQLVAHLHSVQRDLEDEQVKTITLERRLHAQTEALANLSAFSEHEARFETERKAYENTVSQLSKQIEELRDQFKDERPSTSTGYLAVAAATTDVKATEISLLYKTIEHLNLQLADAKRDYRSAADDFLHKSLSSVTPIYHQERDWKIHRGLRVLTQSLQLVSFSVTPPIQTKWTKKQNHCGFIHFQQEEAYAQLLGMKQRLA